MRLPFYAILVAAITTAPTLAADNWAIDGAHSSANFGVKHMMVSTVNGSFHKLTGNVVYNGKDLKGAAVEANIDASTINTGDDGRDKHLRNADFFDVEKFPTITFKSKKVVPQKDGNFDIVGDLTMHGVTKEVTLHAEPMSPPITMKGKTKVGTSATTEINRKDFGLSYGGLLDNGGAMISDKVKIELNLELTKEG